jgi:hypothetical protein
MLNGFKKILRNIYAIKGADAFEKGLIKASFHGDTKEPKEKHVQFILQCLKGRHSELINKDDALAKML